MINTADDIGAPGPDFESGFGNLNLKNAVFLWLDKRFTTETVSEGQTISVPIMVPENIRKIKTTLVWNDPPAALLASKALLHDLDLTLLDPTGNEYSPWVLNSFPLLDSLRQPAHRGRDTLNNVEQITIDFPASGLWEIRVAAPPELSGSQDFALAWNWDTMQHFAWTYPSLNDPVPANREVILRWENNFSDSFARLEWRPLLSPNWRLITDSVQLQRGWQRWIIPDTFTEAQVRMMVGAKEFRSDIFLISKELRMKIGLNCPDSVLLFWNAAHSNAQYQVYGLGAIRMEPILTVSDTFVVLQKSAFPQDRFAVAPFTPEFNAYGPRSPAPDISNQGVACYFRGLLANLNADFNVDLNLSVGTNYGLSKIYFEKLTNGSFTVLNEQNVQQLEYSFLDETLQKGINTYRARILLDNGATLLSDTAKVYYGGENKWWVFPNPIPSTGVLNVVAVTDEPAVFTLFDILGNLVLEKTAEELLLEIPLNSLPKGVYFYKINDGTLLVGGGKLVVE
ncbi:MAG TPA: hypothetical protein DCF33_03655 [Saprospirales bacterium]|nr:hypothetical protein [Saprospirales bacterium]